MDRIKDVDFIRAKDAIILNGYNDRPLSWRGKTWDLQDLNGDSQ